MKTHFPSLNALWAELIMEECARHGITDFVVSPGSRSTPLTVAAARHDRLRTVTHYDERGAAFYALGLTRATGRPVGLICTSGTAAANYLPAVVEAHLEELPLLLLTADRPLELRQSGANQTIEQPRLFGKYVEAEIDLPCPTNEITPDWLLDMLDRMIDAASHGPVHINCQYREPLAPPDEQHNMTSYLEPLAGWHDTDAPYCQVGRSLPSLSQETLDQTAQFLKSTPSGIVVAGHLSDRDAQSVLKLAERLDWPLLPDIRSQLRQGSRSSVVCPYYDFELAGLSSDSGPGVVLHLGGNVTSKRLLNWLDRVRPESYMHVSPARRRFDPNHQVTTRFMTDISPFCEALVRQLPEKNADRNSFGSLSGMAHDKLDVIIARELPTAESLTGPLIARTISKQIIGEGALWLASSSIIRFMDFFASPDGPAVPVASNRGASGIDGTVASAAGWAAGHGRIATLLIGDLALLHDLNSLDLVRKSAVPIVVVVINNDGGGIFSFLPVAECEDVFTSHFVTPHGMTFEAAAGQFGLPYAHPNDYDSFVEAYRKAQRCGMSVVIELEADRDRDAAVTRHIAGEFRSILSES